MDYQEQFVIPFSGLKNGKHQFHFSIDKEFLSCFDIQDIDNISVGLDFLLDRQKTLLTLNFDFKGTITTFCDRCGDDLTLPLVSNGELFVKFGPAAGEETENVVVIQATDTEINISQYIYEFITFAIPLKKIHTKGLCNKEALKKLKEIAGTREKKDTMDPRWQELAKLKGL